MQSESSKQHIACFKCSDLFGGVGPQKRLVSGAPDEVAPPVHEAKMMQERL